MQSLFLLLILCLSWNISIFAQQATHIQRQVSLTFDDLPASYGQGEIILPKLIESLQQYQAPAIGFVNEVKLYENNREVSHQTQLLKNWLKAGLELGNHSYSHVTLIKFRWKNTSRR